MKAKRYLFVITLLLFGLFSGAFLSCSKDDNPQKEPDSENNIVETPNGIVGRWLCKKQLYKTTQYDNNGCVVSENRQEYFPNSIIEFLSDGTTRGSSTCIYSINEDKLTLCGVRYTFYLEGTHLTTSRVSSQSYSYKQTEKSEYERF